MGGPVRTSATTTASTEAGTSMAAESACIGVRARRYPPRSRVDRLASVALVSDGRPRSALAAVRRLKPRWRAPRGNGAHALPTPWDPGGALWPPTLKAADALREPRSSRQTPGVATRRGGTGSSQPAVPCSRSRVGAVDRWAAAGRAEDGRQGAQRVIGGKGSLSIHKDNCLRPSDD